MDSFDQFAQDYKNILDGTLTLSGETGSYFANYKAAYVARSVGGDFSGKVLDYGCGVGLLAQVLLEKMPLAQVHGYDVSPVSIEHIPAHLKQQGLFTANANELKAGQYDLIVVANVMHHVEPHQRQGVIASLKGLLRKGGGLIIFEHNPLNPLTRRVVRESPLDKGVVLLPRAEVCQYLTSAGLGPAHVDYIVFFPKPLSFLRWAEVFLQWCPLGAQYVARGGV